MEKVIVFVVGQDRPGIIAAVSRILFDLGCNLENVSQTILQYQFSGIFIAAVPGEITVEYLREQLWKGISHLNLYIHVMGFAAGPQDPVFQGADSFIITTRGPDRKGLVARITEVIAGHGVNVTNLQAVFKGGDDPNRNIMIYEVDIPESVDQAALSADLRRTAEALRLKISIQHRNVFEAINRI